MLKTICVKVLHYGNRAIIWLLKYLLYIIPKDSKLVLFSAWFGNKYADSPMYVYDYMVKNQSELTPVWYTRNKEVFYQLKKEGLPVVYSKSLKGIWTHLRAKVLVTAIQLFDLCPYLLTNCTVFDLDHGFQLKNGPALSSQQLSYRRLLRINIKYYMSASSYFCMRIVRDYFEVPESNIVLINKPRIDTFYDESLRKNNNVIVDQIKSGRRAIVWMPSHRSDGEKPIDTSSLLDLNRIQLLCEKYNAVFLVKKHFYHRTEVSHFEDYPNIFDITTEQIETQTLLFQADLLISDYSSCYIDYLVLDRPIVLYLYDNEDYLRNERNISVKFEDNHCGFKVYDKSELCEKLSILCKEWKDDLHSNGRKQLKELFIDNSIVLGQTRQDAYKAIKKLARGNDVEEWKE